MGSNLFPAELIKSENWDGITKLCADTIAMIQKVKK